MADLCPPAIPYASGVLDTGDGNRSYYEQWELAKAWPDARLHIIEDSGHAGSDARAVVRSAIEEFKNR
jgi:hypothetical protein